MQKQQEFCQVSRLMIPEKTGPFSSEAITQWLMGEDNLYSKKKHGQSVQGPGQALKWKMFGADPKCFVRQAAANNEPKKKILFCDGLLQYLLKKQGFYPLISRLITDYDCYFWEGPEMDLARAQPIPSAEYFWANLHRVQPAAEKDIVKHFNNNAQLALNEWVILDYSAFWERFNVSRRRLVLQNAVLNVPLHTLRECQQILAGINAEEITYLGLASPPNPEMLNYLLSGLPQLNTINLQNTNPEWVKKNQQIFNNYQFKTYSKGRNKLETFECLKGQALTKQESPYSIRWQSSIKNLLPLIIKEPYELEELINSGKAKEIEALSIMQGAKAIAISSDHFPKLKWLSYSSSAELKESIKLENFPALEYVRLSEMNVISLANNPKLIHLEVEDATVKFSALLPSLKVLVNNQLDLDELKYVPNIEYLFCNFHQKKLSGVRLNNKIRYCRFIDCGNLLNIETGPDLKVFEYLKSIISYNGNVVTLSLKESTELENLIISADKPKIIVNGVESLSKLSVIKLTPDNDTISLRNSPPSSNLSNFPADTISTHTQHSQTITGKSFYSLSKSVSPKVSKGGTSNLYCFRSIDDGFRAK